MYDTGPSWVISEDSLQLRLVLPATPDIQVTFDAAATDVMIATVAKLRASMKPPVDLAAGPSPDASTQTATFSDWRLLPRGDGSATLITAHPGYGWVSLALEPASMKKLAGELTRLVDSSEAALDSQPSHKNTPWDRGS